MDNVVPLSDEALTPEFLLTDVLDQIDDVVAIAIVTIDKEGMCEASWSCPKHSQLCALLFKLQAKVNQAVLE